MIRTIVTYECPRCESLDLVKNGHNYKGAQKYYCKSCGCYGTLSAQGGYLQHLWDQVKRVGMERIFGLSRCSQKNRCTRHSGSLYCETSGRPLDIQRASMY
jgi:transposase-like protein